MQYVEVVVVGLPVCITNSAASGSSSSSCRSSSARSLEAVVESRQGVHSRTSRRRGQSWQQPLVVAVSSSSVASGSSRRVAVVSVVADGSRVRE